MSNILDFGRAAQGTCFCLTSLGELIEVKYFVYLGLSGNKRVKHLAAAPENLQYQRLTLEGERDYELLKKESTNPSNWKFTLTGPRENTSTGKVLEAPSQANW